VEVELLRRIDLEEELRRVKKGRCVEYSVVYYKVTIAFIIIFGMCRREGI
jgi:hypothetical protein